MTLVGFELTISAGERPQTYALDRAATGTGPAFFTLRYFYLLHLFRQQLHEILHRKLRFVSRSTKGHCFIQEPSLVTSQGVCEPKESIYSTFFKSCR